MTTSELVNNPREVTIGGRTLKVRQLKIKELFAHFEDKAIKKKLDDAEKIKQRLEPEERVSFMTNVWNSLPTGEQLTDLATDSMESIESLTEMIYMASKDYDEGLTLETVQSIIGFENIAELAPIVKWISGIPGLEAISDEGVDKKK